MCALSGACVSLVPTCVVHFYTCAIYMVHTFAMSLPCVSVVCDVYCCVVQFSVRMVCRVAYVALMMWWHMLCVCMWYMYDT